MDEPREPAASECEPYDATTRLLHLLLAVGAVAALISGQFAGDYRRPLHAGFDVHSLIGIALAAVLASRVLWGIVGPAAVRFSRWVPVTRARLAPALADLSALSRLRLPARAGHEGLAGLVQAIGLLAFAWMAVTGAALFIGLEPGARATGWLRVVKSLHEGGEPVALAYLFVHAGAVVAHAVAGEPIWRRILPWRKSGTSRT